MHSVKRALRFKLIARAYETLPFIVLHSTFSFRVFYAAIGKVGGCNQGDHYSNHDAPPFKLTRNINPHVASQVLIFIFTFEVLLAGVHVSFAGLFRVLFNYIFGSSQFCVGGG